MGVRGRKDRKKRCLLRLLIPEEVVEKFTSKSVSWLGALLLLQPSRSFSRTVTEEKTLPLTVAGPRRIHTGFPNTLSCGYVNTPIREPCQLKDFREFNVFEEDCNPSRLEQSKRELGDWI